MWMAMSFLFNLDERGRYRTVKTVGMLFITFLFLPTGKLNLYTLINFVVTFTFITYFFYSLFFLFIFLLSCLLLFSPSNTFEMLSFIYTPLKSVFLKVVFSYHYEKLISSRFLKHTSDHVGLYTKFCNSFWYLKISHKFSIIYLMSELCSYKFYSPCLLPEQNLSGTCIKTHNGMVYIKNDLIPFCCRKSFTFS